jgi:catechol 2,3-dioxygenase-like lactoylglutathione lyase family enzyme
VLRKIDCVMIPVPDLVAAAAYYERVFGLTVNWRDDTSVGMRLPESDAEVVLNIECISGVHYLTGLSLTRFRADRYDGIDGRRHCGVPAVEISQPVNVACSARHERARFAEIR